jgi:hypothetical protein
VKQTETLETVYGILSNDEHLLRLLYYHPKNYSDDPLSPSKPNVKDIDTDWSIRRDIIKKSKVVKDLTADTKINRVLIYAGRRIPYRGNYMLADQEIVIDNLVRIEDDDVDFRQLKINDRINDLIFNQKITNFGKVTCESSSPIAAPDGFVGYRLIYRVGSVN